MKYLLIISLCLFQSVFVIKDLKNYFGDEKFTIIGNKLKIELDETQYPLNNDKFIVFYYKINSKEVAKKIGFNNQNLIIEWDKLIVSKGDTLKSNIIKDIDVYQYEQSTRNAAFITNFDLGRVDKEIVNKNIKIIESILKDQGNSKKEIRQYIFDYFYDLYGKTDQDILSKLIEE